MKANMLKTLKNNPLILPIYAPTLLLAFSRGLLIPILPLYVRDFGASYGLIGMVLAAQQFGMLVADMPAGVLLRQLGRKRAMMVGLLTLITTTILLFWARSVYEAMALRFVSGLGMSLFNIARHLYLAEAVKQTTRGRAIALYGGINRIGTFLGPAVGGAAAAAYGLRLPFLLYGVAGGTAVILTLIFVTRTGAVIPGETQKHGLLNTIKTHYRLLAAAGTAQLFAQTVRAGRNVIIPLIGADVLGLDVQAIGTIISAAAAVDMTLFYPAGWVMDRFGRKFAIVPSFLIQATGMALLPLATGFTTLLMITCLIGFGNGVGSGTMMTLGADLAPTATRSEFLGTWRFIGDGGFTLGPIIVGGVADLLVLQTAALFLAGSGILAGLIFARFVPETLKRHDMQIAD
ncbi:MAG: MFS transporter [Chloroflexi bacterium]|nr:MAG: MFS transporter [Chloroflexota bacterium]